MRSVRGRKAFIALSIAAAAVVSAPQTAMAEHRAFNYAVVARDFRFVGIPRLMPAGTYDTRFINIGHAPHVIVPINLGEECADLTTAELIEAFDLGEVDFFTVCPSATVGGEVFAFGGEQARGTLSLTPGRTVFACFVNRHYALGMISSTNVINIG